MHLCNVASQKHDTSFILNGKEWGVGSRQDGEKERKREREKERKREREKERKREREKERKREREKERKRERRSVSEKGLGRGS